MSTKSRAYQFTWHNPTDEDREYLKQVTCKYLCWGEEICPTTGREHLQGLIVFENQRSFEAVRKTIFQSKHHIEAARSTEALIKYNKKDGKFFETGVQPKQGERTDLIEQFERVRNGATDRELWIADPASMVRYHKAFKAARLDMMEHRTERPIVAWLWGGTGTGKTSAAMNLGRSVYIKDGTQWWDGYVQQDIILIDDFDGKWPFRDLLRLLDAYPYQGQVKGAYVKINSPMIVITCEFPPDRLWAGTDLDQILRRLEVVTEVTNSRPCLALEPLLAQK